MDTAKSIFKSKTFWVAVLQAVVGVLLVVHSQFPAMGYVVVGKSVLDVIIRMMTSEAVTL